MACHRSSKLVMRVRLPSPAPPRKPSSGHGQFSFMLCRDARSRRRPVACPIRSPACRSGGEGHCPPTRLGLGIVVDEPSAICLGRRDHDAHGAPLQVDLATTQRSASVARSRRARPPAVIADRSPLAHHACVALHVSSSSLSIIQLAATASSPSFRASLRDGFASLDSATTHEDSAPTRKMAGK